MLVGEFKLEANFVVESLGRQSASVIDTSRVVTFTNLDDADLSYGCHTTPDVLFSAIELEAIVSENDL